MEIGIPRADLLDAMLAHKNGRVHVVKNAARQMWNLRNGLAGNVGMPFSRNKDR